MKRILILLLGLSMIAARTGLGQVSPDEAYRRLREKQAQRRAAESRPAAPAATKPSSSTEDDAALGIAPPKSTPAPTNPGQKYSEYHDAKLGFKLKYPEKWKQQALNDRKNNVVDFMADEPDDDDLTLEVLRVEKLEVYAHSNLDGMMARAEEAYKRGQNAPIEIISESDITMAGAQGKEFVYIGQYQGRPLKGVVALTIARNEGWMLSIGMNPKSSNHRIELFEAVVKSFELVKPALPMPLLVDHSDAAHGFKMKYPSDWKIGDSASPIVFSFSSEDVKMEPPMPWVNVNVIYASHVPPGKTRVEAALDEYMEANEKQIKARFPNVQWLTVSSTDLNGVSARRLIYTVKRKDGESRVLQVMMLVGNGQNYTITFTTAPKDFDQLLPIMDNILGSFRALAAR